MFVLLCAQLSNTVFDVLERCSDADGLVSDHGRGHFGFYKKSTLLGGRPARGTGRCSLSTRQRA